MSKGRKKIGLLMGGIPLYTRRQSQWLTAHQPSVPITSV